MHEYRLYTLNILIYEPMMHVNHKINMYDYTLYEYVLVCYDSIIAVQ